MFKVALFDIGKLFARYGRISAGESELENLGQVEPAVCSIRVVLAHDEGFLTACDCDIGEILFIYSLSRKNFEKRVVVEQRRSENAGGEEETSHLLIELFGGILMKLNGENRLGEVHVVVCVEKCVSSFVRKVVSVNVASAYYYVLRDSPASVRNIEKYKKMLEKRRRHFTGKSVSVRLENSVRIAY